MEFNKYTNTIFSLFCIALLGLITAVLFQLCNYVIRLEIKFILFYIVNINISNEVLTYGTYGPIKTMLALFITKSKVCITHLISHQWWQLLHYQMKMSLFYVNITSPCNRALYCSVVLFQVFQQMLTHSCILKTDIHILSMLLHRNGSRNIEVNKSNNTFPYYTHNQNSPTRVCLDCICSIVNTFISDNDRGATRPDGYRQDFINLRCNINKSSILL
jgi:hypothetical protein